MQPPASMKVDGCDWAAHIHHGRETHADASLDGISGLHSGCEIVNTKVASNASVTALREQLEQGLYRFRAVNLCIEGRVLLGSEMVESGAHAHMVSAEKATAALQLFLGGLQAVQSSNQLIQRV